MNGLGFSASDRGVEVDGRENAVEETQSVETARVRRLGTVCWSWVVV